MKICKLQMAIFFYCALFLCTQAHAQWPVFDFTEIGPIVGQITTTGKTVNNLKNQLTEMIETLDGIGKNAKTIAEFSKDINENDEQEKDHKPLEQAADDFAKTSDSNTEIHNDFTNQLSDAAVKQDILMNQLV
ncbi:MAG: hypothetical protein J6W96_00465, partial [Alphaproteobacteria bacterium]|nr:hypothetical protein [Alphaproteobacteria bacterium]